MSIRVLLVAAMVVGLVASLVTIGSQAFFGDTETSTGNVAEAGVMDIQVNGLDDPLGAIVSYTSAGDNDVKPSRDLEPVVARITNSGQNAGHLDLHYKNVVVSGGILSEPECTEQGGTWDSATAVCSNLTNDANNINDFFEIDVHDVVSGVSTQTGCDNLTPSGTWYSPPDVCAQNPAIIDSTPLGPANDDATSPGIGIESLCIELGEITVNESRDILLTFHLHESAGNEYQGDIITFDIEFTLHQDNDPTVHAADPGDECGTGIPIVDLTTPLT